MKKQYWISFSLGILTFCLFIFIFFCCVPIAKTNVEDVFEYFENKKIINVSALAQKEQEAYSDYKFRLNTTESRLKNTSWILYIVSSIGFFIVTVYLFYNSYKLRRHN